MKVVKSVSEILKENNLTKSPAGRVYRMYESSKKKPKKKVSQPTFQVPTGDKSRSSTTTPSSVHPAFREEKQSHNSHCPDNFEEVAVDTFCEKCFEFYPCQIFEEHSRVCGGGQACQTLPGNTTSYDRGWNQNDAKVPQYLF